METFGQQASSRPRFDAAHVAYYAGAVIVLAAMGWLLTEAWDALNGFAVRPSRLSTPWPSGGPATRCGPRD